MNDLKDELERQKFIKENPDTMRKLEKVVEAIFGKKEDINLKKNDEENGDQCIPRLVDWEFLECQSNQSVP